MIKVKIDSIKEDDEKKYFYVSAEIGTQRSRSVNFKTKDIVFVSLKGVFDKKKGKPSSEWRFHQDIYVNKKDANAIVAPDINS